MTHSDGMIAYAEYLLDTRCPYRDITTLTGICSTTLGQIKQRMRDGDPTLPPAWDPSLPPPRSPSTASTSVTYTKVKEPAELLAVQTFAVAYNATVLANDTLIVKKPPAEFPRHIRRYYTAVRDASPQASAGGSAGTRTDNTDTQREEGKNRLQYLSTDAAKSPLHGIYAFIRCVFPKAGTQQVSNGDNTPQT